MADTVTADAGILDKPLPISSSEQTVSTLQPAASLSAAGNAQQVTQVLRTELVKEQLILEKLPREDLQERADLGERAAQVTLAEDFAKEAALLAFAPAAANDALSDAVRWYSQAARRGFPGAPSLDQAGVKFYPIRAHRSR